MSDDLLRPIFSDRDRRLLSQDLFRGLAEADSSGFGMLIDDSLAETDLGDGESRAERPGMSFGRDIARERAIPLPGHGVAGDFHGYLRATDPRHAAAAALDARGLAMPAAHTQALRALDGWATAIEDQLLAKNDAFTMAEVRESLTGRYQPLRAAGELVGGLSYDNHLTRYTELLANADTVSIGLFSAEHPIVAAAMTETYERVGPGGFSLRTNEPLGYVGRGYGRYYQEAFGEAASRAPKLRLGQELSSYRDGAAAHLAGELKITDHFKYAAANLHDPERAVIAIGSANATGAALGGIGRNRTAYGRGSNVESMAYLRAQDFTNAATFTSLTGQMQRAHAWNLSNELDLGQEQALVAAARSIFQEGQGRTVTTAIQTELSKITTGALESMFTGPETSGVSRVLSGHGLQRKHQELLKAMGAGDSAMITSYNYGDTFLDEVKAAVDRGAKITLLSGARYDFTNGVSLRADGEITERLQAAALGRDGLDVVINESELVHAKVSMFKVAGQGHALYGSMNFDDDQYHNLYYNQSKAGYAGAVRNLGVYLSASEYARYGADQRVTENLIAMSRLTTRMIAGTGHFDGDGAAIRKLFAGFGVGGNNLQIHASGKGIESIRASVSGVFDVGGRSYDLGRIMSLTMVKPTEAANKKGFGFDGQYFVPELYKFVGPSWTVAEAGKGGPGELSAMGVIAAGVAATQGAVSRILNELYTDLGAEEFGRRMDDPIYRGILRSQIKQYNRHTLRNLQGVEAGTPAFGAKGFSRLMFKTNEHGVDMSSVAELDAVAIDRALTRGNKWLLGNREFFFTASGASRRNSRGETKPARFYDIAALDTLPVAGRGDNGELMFLFPISKLAQLPQRLQSILAARHLTPETDPMIIQSIKGARSAQSIMATSQFEAADGSRLKGLRFQGFALPGLSGDQNAYLIGERFEGMYFGNEPWRKTVKISMQTAVPGDQGRLLVEQLTDLVSTQKAQSLGDERYLLTHEALTELQHRLNVANHRIHDTGLIATEALDLGTEHIRGQALVLDTKRDRGMSLVKNDGYWSLTISGTPLEQITSGSRSMLGAKTPHVMIHEGSSAVTAIHGAMRTVYGGQGGYTKLGMQDFNVLFGSGAIKSGQAFVETGIELLKTGVWSDQLGERGTVDMKKYQHVIRKLAGFLDAGSEVRGQMVALANQAESGNLGPAELNRLLAKSARHLNAGGGASLSRSGAAHTAAAIMAFGIHAQFSIDALLKSPEAQAQLQGAFGKPNISEHGALTFENLGDQQLLGGIWMTWVSGLSALATPVSTRNRVNFLNYHAGGYTDAFFNLMAISPEVRERAAAFNEIMVGGLLGRGGQDDVVFANDFNPMSKHFKGAAVDGFDPFMEAQADVKAARAVFAGAYKGSNDPEQLLRDLRTRRSRVAQGMAAVNAHLDGHRAAGTSVYTASGGMESSGIHHHLEATERAGIGSRTVLVPELGYVDGRGQFRFDPGARGARAQVRYREMVFLGSKGLRALGSLEDFSSRINQLQVRAERLMVNLGSLDDAVRGRGLDYYEQDQYRELMETMGMLADAQRAAAATSLQQLLGGQLAAVGKNVIAGTLPGVAPRELVIGRAVWEFMKAEAAESVFAGLSADGANPVAGIKRLFSRLRTELADTTLVDAVQAQFENPLSPYNVVKNQLEGVKFRMVELNQRTRAAYAGASNERQAMLRGRLGTINSSLNRATAAFAEWRTVEYANIDALYSHMRATFVDPLITEIDSARLAFEGAQAQRQATAAQLGAVRQRLVHLQRARGFAALQETRALRGVDNRIGGLKRTINELEGRLRAFENDRTVVFAAELASEGDGDYSGSDRLYRDQIRGIGNRLLDLEQDLWLAETERGRIAAGVDGHHLTPYDKLRRARQVTQASGARYGLAASEYAMLEQYVIEDWRTAEAARGQHRELRNVNLAKARVESRGISRRMRQERNKLAGLEQAYWNEIHADDQGLRMAARAEVDSYYQLRTSEIDIGHESELASLRAQKRALSARLSGQGSMNAAVQEHLAMLMDDPLVRKALGMVAVGQRSGAPMGPEAIIFFDRIVTDSEYSRRHPELMLHKELNDRGAFLNLGAMGFFLGDFDGDNFGIAPLKEYMRLRTIQAVGGKLDAVQQKALGDVVTRLNYTEEEQLFAFGRHYTGLTSIFNDQALYIGSDRALAGKSVDEARTIIHDVRALADGRAQAMGLEDMDSAYKMHKGLGTTNQLLQSVFGGGEAVHGLDEGQMRMVYEGFQGRRAIARDLGTSTNQYVTEMMKTHNAVFRYMQENVGRGTRTELFERFFQTKGSDLFAQELFKSAESVTGQLTKGEAAQIAAGTMRSDEVKPLKWNELITFFVMTSYASSNIIAKVFEATYTMLADADRIRALRRADAAAMTSSSVLADEHFARVQGLGIVLQQIARASIKPKGEGDPLDVVRSQMAASERKGLFGWLHQNTIGRGQVVSGIAAVVAQFEGVDWFHRLVTSTTIDDKKFDVGAMTDSDWETAHTAIKKQLAGYHQEALHGAFADGVLNKQVLDEFYRGQVPDGVDAQLFDTQLPEDAGAREAKIAERKAMVDTLIETTSSDQANLLIEQALAASGSAQNQKAYRMALASNDPSEFHRATAGMVVEERLHEFYKMTARGKFTDPVAMKTAVLDIFREFADVDVATGAQELETLARESSGSDEYGRNLKAIFESYAAGSDFNAAYLKGLRHSRANFDVRAKKEKYADTLRSTLLERGELDAETKTRAEKASLFELQGMIDERSEVLKRENLGSKDQVFLKTLFETTVASGYDQMRQDHLVGIGLKDYSSNGVPLHPVGAGIGASAIESLVKGSSAHNLAVGTVAGVVATAAMFAAMPQGAYASTGEAPDGWHTAGELTGAALAFLSPKTAFQSMMLSNQDLKEKAAMIGTFGAAMAAGVAVTAPAHKAAVNWALGGHDPEESRGRSGARVTGRAGLVGMAAATAAATLVGGFAGVLASYFFQSMGLMREINPVPEMLNQLMGFAFEGFEQAMDDDLNELWDAEGDGEHSVEGVVQIRDAAGELVHQDFYRFNWAAMEDEAEFDAAGFITAGLDSFVSSADYEESGLA